MSSNRRRNARRLRRRLGGGTRTERRPEDLAVMAEIRSVVLQIQVTTRPSVAPNKPGRSARRGVSIGTSWAHWSPYAVLPMAYSAEDRSRFPLGPATHSRDQITDGHTSVRSLILSWMLAEVHQSVEASMASSHESDTVLFQEIRVLQNDVAGSMGVLDLKTSVFDGPVEPCTVTDTPAILLSYDSVSLLQDFPQPVSGAGVEIRMHTTVGVPSPGYTSVAARPPCWVVHPAAAADITALHR